MEKDVKTQDVRAKIIAAARELFVQRGFDGVSVRDIASMSGTNIAMVNYYFRSKHNLFAEIFGDAFRLIGGKVFSLLESDLPFLEMLRQWIYAYYDTLEEYSEMPLFVFSELTRRPGMLEDQIDVEIPRKLYEGVMLRLQEEIDKKTIRPMNPVNFGLTMLSLCIFPYLFTPIASNYVGLGREEYLSFLQEHKKFVADFIIHSIKMPD